jgi:DNA-binding protein H-NS
MKTFATIKAEIAKLEKQAEQVRKAEVAGVIARIKQAIAAYGLTAKDLGFAGAATSPVKSSRAPKSTRRPNTGVARYRDPASGKTWTGQGRPPAWIADVPDREAFRMRSTANSNPLAGGTSATRQAPSKRSASKKGRTRRKTAVSPVRTAAVQMESGAASE